MSRARTDFMERKRSAEDTALWMKADVHKAQSAGEAMVMMKVRDLVEVFAYIDAVKHRDMIEYADKHLGYARPDDVMRLKKNEIRGIVIMTKKGIKFCMPVGFVGEIPEMPVAKPEKVLEDSTC